MNADQRTALLNAQVLPQWEAGWRAAQARSQNDEARAQHHIRWSEKSKRISSDRRAEGEAFDRGYRMYYSGYYLSDNPYPH